mgnify:CR=1 FL=1|jgi:hypothetical protein
MIISKENENDENYKTMKMIKMNNVQIKRSLKTYQHYLSYNYH